MANSSRTNGDSPLASGGRPLERQHQLSAQRRNEEFWRQDYHNRNARYFQRETESARQHSFWTRRDSGPRSKLEEAKRSERLLIKRHKLRCLFQQEEEQYRKEIEEQDRQLEELARSTDPGAAELRKKLLEKRAEQLLYEPRTCHKCQHCFTLLNSPSQQHLCINPYLPRPDQVEQLNKLSTPENPPQLPQIPPQSPPQPEPSTVTSTVCRDTTNIMSEVQPAGLSLNKSRGNTDLDLLKHNENQENDFKPMLNKYKTRYARKSMEYTNINCIDETLASDKSKMQPNGNDEIMSDSKIDEVDRAIPSIFEAEEILKSDEIISLNDNGEAKENEDPAKFDKMDIGESDDSFDKRNATDMMKVQKSDHLRFESEKALPWLRMDPNDKNLSEQMFVYLTHKDITAQIEDLSHREVQACTRRNWGEALRLRDMCNKLELLREKRLYSLGNSSLDEETRRIGLRNIEKRSEELAKRSSLTTDSSLYSEDAKKLWQQWVAEDNRTAVRETDNDRDVLMRSLEKEWQKLAIEDKEKIYNSSQGIVSDSFLQKEHKLAANALAAKSKSNSGADGHNYSFNK